MRSRESSSSRIRTARSTRRCFRRWRRWRQGRHRRGPVALFLCCEDIEQVSGVGGQGSGGTSGRALAIRCRVNRRFVSQRPPIKRVGREHKGDNNERQIRFGIASRIIVDARSPFGFASSVILPERKVSLSVKYLRNSRTGRRSRDTRCRFQARSNSKGRFSGILQPSCSCC
jgi:hypothetical protein